MNKNNYALPLLLLLLAWSRSSSPSSSSSKPAAKVDPSKPVGIDRNWRAYQ